MKTYVIEYHRKGQSTMAEIARLSDWNAEEPEKRPPILGIIRHNGQVGTAAIKEAGLTGTFVIIKYI